MPKTAIAIVRLTYSGLVDCVILWCVVYWTSVERGLEFHMTGKSDHRGDKSFLFSFIRSSKAVWFVELLLLFAIAVVVYNDWDMPVRNFLCPSSSLISVTSSSFRKRLLESMKWTFFCAYALVTVFIAQIIAMRRTHRELCERIESLRNEPMRAEVFLKMRSHLAATKMLGDSEFTGVYILHNVTKGKYYVGQSIRVLSRINQHLTGHGNGDVYADFKYGDGFTVSTIPMQGSGYQSLNDLERDAISAYNAKDNGYNMTYGNRR